MLKSRSGQGLKQPRWGFVIKWAAIGMVSAVMAINLIHGMLGGDWDF